MGVRGATAGFYTARAVRDVSGEKTAVEIALEVVEEPFTQAEQLDMLGLTPNARVVALADARDAKIGRPKGARNRRTEEMAAFLLSRYTSPLEILAQIATTQTDLLASSLGCDKLQALAEKRLAAMALLPYVHSKMPVAVDVTNHRIIHLTLEDPSAPASDEDDHITLTGTILSRSAPDGE